MKRWLRVLLAALVPLVPLGSTVAGTIALEGSDATSLHQASGYSAQLFSFLKNDSYNPLLPVLVWNDNGTVSISGAPAGTTYATSLSSFSTLVGAFSAIYIQSPSGCCSENEVTSASDIAKINALMAAGGSLAINDYQGGNLAILSAAIAGFAPASANFAGYMGGSPAGFSGLGGTSCWDTEVFLPGAIAKGFTQPGVLGCWGHQAYDLNYFSTFGFISLVDSGPQFDGIGNGNWSSFLALGGSLGTVPEPGSLALLGLGIFGLATIRRRRRT